MKLTVQKGSGRNDRRGAMDFITELVRNSGDFTVIHQECSYFRLQDINLRHLLQPKFHAALIADFITL